MTEASHSQPQRGVNTTLIAIIVILVVALYFPVLRPLFDQWMEDSNYRHGLLVPIISGLLLYQRREELAAAKPGGGSLLGCALILLSGVLLVAGTAANEFMTARLSLPTFLLGASLFLRGSQFTRVAAFPLLFMYLMIPLPYIIYYKIAFPLQLFSAKVSAAFLDWIGVTIVRQGNVLHLPGYTLEVVAACSGLRSLMTMVTLSLIIGVFGDLSTTKRTALAACAIPAAIAANSIRLVVTSLGAYMVSSSFADGFLHDLSGVVVFVVGLVILLTAYFVLRRLG